LFLVASGQLAALAEDTCNRIQTLHTLRLWSHELLQNTAQITVLKSPGSIPKVCTAVYTHYIQSLYHRDTIFSSSETSALCWIYRISRPTRRTGP
jgi:hypothetical protein